MKKRLLIITNCFLCLFIILLITACSKTTTTTTATIEPVKGDVYYGRTQIIKDSDKYLVENGTSEYKILLREDASKAENYAAVEFNVLLELAAGIKLDVVYTADLDQSTKYISIGNTALATKAGKTVSKNSMNRNGFKLLSYGDGLLILAGDNTGLIYGVQRFFEKNSNYMYYTPDEIKIDKSDNIKLLNYDFEDWPDFPERDVYNNTTKTDPETTMKYYLNGSIYSKWDEMYGEGTWWSSLYDQSMEEQICPSKVYGAEHPDWYYGPGGDTNATRSQLCFTKALYDKGSYDPYTSGLLKSDGTLTDDEHFSDGTHGLFWTFCYNLIKNYVSVETDKTLFQLGMSDNEYFCDCDKCKEDINKYTRSGLVIRFANQVADVVKEWQKKNCPERTIYFTIFAYLTVVQPPVTYENGEYVPIDDSVVLRDNIVLRYAPMLEGYLFPLLDEKHNARANIQMNGWKALASHFAVWDYTINFGEAYQTFPNWMASYENLKSYYDYGYIDIYNQGNGMSTNLSFYYMDMWVRSRLLWDIHQDYNELMNEFIDVYYGEGAPIIRDYIDKLTFHYLNHMQPMGYNGSATAATTTIKNYPLSFVEGINDSFAYGISMIKNSNGLSDERKDTLVKRLEYESMFFRYVEITLYSSYFSKDDLIAKIDDFERICKNGNLGGLRMFTNSYDIIIEWRSKL